jgi:hypothetical protein
MARFDIKGKTIKWVNGLRIIENNPGNIVVDTSQLQVQIQVEAQLFNQDESYYLGYVQIVTYNNQHNHYGNHVDQRWEFSAMPLSDSLSKDERPWYGLERDYNIGGWRRQYLPKPSEDPAGGTSFDLQMNMSDNFEMKIAKFENLANGSAGPNAITRVTREQWFRIWLVAVEESKVNDLASYKRLMEIDWGYRINFSVRLDGANADLGVDVDTPWHTVKFGDFMDKIPSEALTAPVGNENQQLNYYLDGVLKHVVVPRQG